MFLTRKKSIKARETKLGCCERTLGIPLLVTTFESALMPILFCESFRSVAVLPAPPDDEKATCKTFKICSLLVGRYQQEYSIDNEKVYFPVLEQGLRI